MSINLTLPEDLSPDMKVLFIKPYSAAQMCTIKNAINQDQALVDAFNAVNHDDPNLERFEDTVAIVKTYFKLGGYIVGNDMIILYGDQETLDKAQHEIERQTDYTCFQDTLEDFFDDVKAKPPVQKKGGAQFH